MGHDLFPFSISSDDVANTKPHPDAYLKAASISDADISNCLIFEDSPTGLTAARASGAFVVGIPHFVEVLEEPRLKIVKSFNEVSM